MDLDRIINSIHTFIVYQPFISMGIAAALGILIYIKPKEVLKVILTFLAIVAIGYILYYLWVAFQSGYLNKGEMVNKSLQ